MACDTTAQYLSAKAPKYTRNKIQYKEQTVAAELELKLGQAKAVDSTETVLLR